MTLNRRNPRRDQSEAPIVDALRTFGFSVGYISGTDYPDLFLGKSGITRLAEVKSGTKPLRPGQADWWQRWKGNGKIVLRSPEDVPVLASLWGRLAVDVGALVELQREKRQRAEVGTS